MATRGDPFADLLTLRQDVDRLIASFGPQPEHPGEASSLWMPAVDAFKHDGDIVVRAELPGMNPAEINVAVSRNALTIKGERRRDPGIAEGDYVMRESTYGAFERRVTMPADIDASQVRAQYRAGILEVTVPAAALMAPPPRPVQVAGAPAGAAAEGEGAQPYGQQPLADYAAQPSGFDLGSLGIDAASAAEQPLERPRSVLAGWFRGGR